MTITLEPTNSTNRPSIPPPVHTRLVRPALAVVLAASLVTTARAQAGDSNPLHWREIGPTRAGRARALAGVPSQPNVFYAGFDNGGVWRSTDYGSTWVPLFDSQPTGPIGAIGVAPSDPNVIYVGSGAGSFARTSPSATGCTNPPMAARRGRTSAFATAR